VKSTGKSANCTIVVDRLDPTFHFDADSDPDPNRDWHQNNVIPLADPTPRFTHIGK
jgi:hypothetical protein